MNYRRVLVKDRNLIENDYFMFQGDERIYQVIAINQGRFLYENIASETYQDYRIKNVEVYYLPHIN